MNDYHDSKLSVDAHGIGIRWYYLWGAKRIPLASVKGVERAPVTILGGRGRIWGSANPTMRYWANLDAARPGKTDAFILDLGHHVRPFVTPDDPDAFESALRSHLPDATFTANTGARHLI